MKDRNTQIIKQRKVGITQQEIADSLGITRQRVQQLERKLGLGARRIPGIPTLHSFVCRQCKKTVSSKLKRRTYCSRECFFQSRKELFTPEQKLQKEIKNKEKNRNRASYYYYNVLKQKSNWKEIIKERNKKTHVYSI